MSFSDHFCYFVTAHISDNLIFVTLSLPIFLIICYCLYLWSLLQKSANIDSNNMSYIHSGPGHLRSKKHPERLRYIRWASSMYTFKNALKFRCKKSYSSTPYFVFLLLHFDQPSKNEGHCQRHNIPESCVLLPKILLQTVQQAEKN